MEFFIVGAGGFGRETLDAALALDLKVSSFVDEDERLANKLVRGLPVVSPASLMGGNFVLAIADPSTRRRLATALQTKGLEPRTLIHPKAVMAPEAEVGAGAVILANVYLSSGVRLGRHAHVNYNATVGHDSRLGNYVTVLPGANVGGNVELGDAVTVGTNACILQGLTIGEGATVGAGAAVVRNVAAGATVKGVPAR